MPLRNVQLTDYFEQFVDGLVSSGRFSDASDVVRAGLRLLEQVAREDDAKLVRLRALAAEAFSELDQRQGVSIENPDQLADFMAQIGQRAAELVDHAPGEG